jgi:hypothetical protein
MANPQLDVVLAVGLEFGEAKARDVRSDDPEVRRELGHDLAPVGPGGDAGAGTMEQEERLAAALLQVVGLMLCGKKVLANAGVLVHFSSVFEYTCMCMVQIFSCMASVFDPDQIQGTQIYILFNLFIDLCL